MLWRARGLWDWMGREGSAGWRTATASLISDIESRQGRPGTTAVQSGRPARRGGQHAPARGSSQTRPHGSTACGRRRADWERPRPPLHTPMFRLAELRAAASGLGRKAIGGTAATEAPAVGYKAILRVTAPQRGRWKQPWGESALRAVPWNSLVGHNIAVTIGSGLLIGPGCINTILRNVRGGFGSLTAGFRWVRNPRQAQCRTACPEPRAGTRGRGRYGWTRRPGKPRRRLEIPLHRSTLVAGASTLRLRCWRQVAAASLLPRKQRSIGFFSLSTDRSA